MRAPRNKKLTMSYAQAQRTFRLRRFLDGHLNEIDTGFDAVQVNISLVIVNELASARGFAEFLQSNPRIHVVGPGAERA